MDPINFTRPIDEHYVNTGLETALSKAFKKVFAQNFEQSLQDLLDYGCPHIGSKTVIERFSKQNGLVVLRRNNTSDTLMRIIYSNWSSMGNKRGIAFLEFILRMLWGKDHFQIIRLWHSLEKLKEYPIYLSDVEKPNYFLTSRIRIVLDKTVDANEVVELSPILRRLVPANIVVKVHSMAFDRDLGASSFAAAIVAKPFEIYNLI
ncbi:hypothetical protein IIQ44_03880 [Acinetobacter oleivorans]|uniref:hypothetical protein n=1 Tax=Acinetobacter TaxID=469 RepID=UPI00178CBDBE|nr:MULTISPECIES: hypothetical protein [Acinetobacter]MBE2171043.1 hypothetical protein [Acinetobacter oleivorans]MEB3865882.1 hypothetical protein [Acinetobacter sp. IK31]